MKKGLILFLLMIFPFLTQAVEAKTIKMIAITQNDFSTNSSIKDIALKISGNYEINSSKHIPDGLLLDGTIVKIREPKRGKLGAVAYFQLKSYTIPSSGKTVQVKNPNAIGKITEYKPLDIKSKSVDLGVSAAGLLVDNISYPINFVRGVATAEEGENRLKAGAELTYEKSMLSYFSKGKHINVPAGGQVIFTLEYNEK